MKSQFLDSNTARTLLNEFSRRAKSRGIDVEIYVFGGAAVAMRYDLGAESRETEDIDAFLTPQATDPQIAEIVSEMAHEFELTANWLNDSGRTWVLPSPRGTRLRSDDAFDVATFAELLAMKFDRGNRADAEDIALIAQRESITNAEELVTIAESVIPEGSMLWAAYPREDFVLFAEQILRSNDNGKRDQPS